MNLNMKIMETLKGKYFPEVIVGPGNPAALQSLR